MNLLALVLAGHFIGDWIIQTDWQAANKTSSWRAMTAHVASYQLAQALLLGFAWPPHRSASLLLLYVVSATTHAFLDRRWPVVWLMRHTGSRPFSETPWGVIAVDQALHISILCLLVAWLA